MRYRYKLKDNAKTQSYGYKGIFLKKDVWYYSDKKIKFPNSNNNILEEIIGADLKKENEDNIDDTYVYRDYEPYFKYWTTPVYDKNGCLKYKVFPKEFVNLIIIQEKKLVRDLNLKWDNKTQCYLKKNKIKKIFLKSFFLGKKGTGWQVFCKILNKEVNKFHSGDVTQVKNFIQYFLKAKITI